MTIRHLEPRWRCASRIDPGTERLARTLAERSGETTAIATKRGLEERLRRVGSDARKAALLENRAAGRCRWSALPVLDTPQPRRVRQLRQKRPAALMVIDASAILAIALDAPRAPCFELRISNDPVRLISVATVFEAAMVLETRLGEAGGSALDPWLHKAGVGIVAVGAEHAGQARRAWRRYGKRRHPAGLNFAGCFSYALAALTGEPLLYKGGGFSQTDIPGVKRS